MVPGLLLAESASPAVYAVWVVVIVLVGLLVGFLVLQTRFHNTPEKQWAQRLLDLLARAKRLRQGEHDRAALFHRQLEKEIADRTERAFDEFCSAITIDDLARFEGIGSGTTAKLREHGITNLAKLRRFNPLSIQGIGDKRGRDIRRAEQQLEAEAQARFQRRDVQIAQELERTVLQLRHQAEEQRLRQQARIRALDQAYSELENAADLVYQVAFVPWLAGRTKDIIPADLQHLPEMQLETLLREAEAKALASWQPPPPPAALVEPAKPAAASPPPASPPPRPGAGRPTEKRSQSPRPPVSPPAPPPEDKRAIILEAGVVIGALMARAHGRFTQAERQEIDRFLAQKAADDPVLQNKGRNWLAFYEAGPINLEEVLKRLEQVARAVEKGERRDLARGVALARHDIEPQELAVLAQLSARWGIALDLGQRQALSPQATPPLGPAPAARAEGSHDPRAVLELDPTWPLSVDLIRRQYRMLTDRLDLDQIARFGPDFVAKAEAKLAAIRAAAESLIAPFNEPLEAPETPPPPSDLRHNPDLDALFG